jgi:hypothetical protein
MTVPVTYVHLQVGAVVGFLLISIIVIVAVIYSRRRRVSQKLSDDAKYLSSHATSTALVFAERPSTTVFYTPTIIYNR